MTGLRLMNEIMDPATRDDGARGRTRSSEAAGRRAASAEPAAPRDARAAAPRFASDVPIPPAPYLDRSVRDVPHLAEVWSYINPFMLYGRHLGYKGNFEKAARRARSQGARALSTTWKRSSAKPPRFMKVSAVWQFFEAERDGNAIHLFAPGAARARSTRSTSAASRRENGLCLSDYILDPADGQRDHMALFVVTAGEGIRERSEEAKQAGRVLQGARAAGAGDRNRRRLRRVAAPPHPRGLGLPRSARR